MEQKTTKQNRCQADDFDWKVDTSTVSAIYDNFNIRGSREMKSEAE